MVRNIGLIGGSVASDSPFTGSLVGMLRGSLVNSYATGVVIGVDDVGGLIGSSTGIIQNSYASGTVKGTYRTGGLVGRNQGSVTESYATGTVTGSNEVGGLVGRNDNTVSKSYAAGAVTGADAVGGLVGWNENNQTVSNSYATGAVTATNRRVGGLVGMNRLNANVINSYATGVIQGNDAGGLVGWNDGNVSNSFWNTDVFAVGTNGASKYFTGMTGLSTAQMKVQANFTSATTANGNVNPGWDMSSTWVQYDTHTAPLLRSFMTALTVSANDATKTYDGLGTTGGNGVTYSTAPDMGKLLGTVSYSSDVNVGSSNLALGGLYSSQQGYLIDYVDGTMTIVPKALTVAGVTALDKVYDGTTLATLAGGTLTGLISGDTVTLIEVGTFATPNTGNGIAVTAAVSLGGASAGNYTVTQPIGLTANITAPISTAPVSGVDSNPRNQNAIASAVSLMSAMPLQDNMADAQWPSPQVGNDASMPGGLTGLNLSITGNGVKLPSACNEEMHATTGTDC
jgi:The GLUG motif.